MNCIVCNTSKCAHNPQLEYKYKDNKVVLQALKQPQVLSLLMQMISCQVANPARFSPIPDWFRKSESTEKDDITAVARCLDVDKLAATISAYNPDKCAKLIDTCKTDQDLLGHMSLNVYMLLRFAVVSMPIKLSPVVMKLQDTTVDMYQVVHSADVESKFVQLDKTPTYLYHGSPMTNWHSITHNGLRVMSGTSYQTTGAVHGDGIYLTDLMSRSYAYCSSRGNGDFMIGVYEVYDSELYKKTEDIHVVPSQDKLLLRYLLWISGKVQIKELGTEMNNLLKLNAQRRAQAIKNSTKKATAVVTAKIAKLDPAYTAVQGDTAFKWSFLVDDKKMMVEFPTNYPFEQPRVTLDGKKCAQLPLWKVQWDLTSVLDSYRYSD